MCTKLDDVIVVNLLPNCFGEWTALLPFGVLQGSVIVQDVQPLLETTKRPSSRTRLLEYHLYGEDTQIYMSFKQSGEHAFQQEVVSNIEHFLIDIDIWMRNNMLKLNIEKPNMILLTCKYKSKASNNISVDIEGVNVSSDL